jgi:hypothetical protein
MLRVRRWREMFSMRAWRITIALTLGILLFGLGALSAGALARHPDAAPDCGTPSVDTIPCIESGHHDGVVPLDGETKIGVLRVRAGHWFLIAKVVVTSALSSPRTAPCTLTAEDSVDVSDAVLPPHQGTTATMTVVHTFAASGPAVVTCNGAIGVSASSLKITAIRAGTLFDQGI